MGAAAAPAGDSCRPRWVLACIYVSAERAGGVEMDGHGGGGQRAVHGNDGASQFCIDQLDGMLSWTHSTPTPPAAAGDDGLAAAEPWSTSDDWSSASADDSDSSGLSGESGPVGDLWASTDASIWFMGGDIPPQGPDVAAGLAGSAPGEGVGGTNPAWVAARVKDECGSPSPPLTGPPDPSAKRRRGQAEAAGNQQPRSGPRSSVAAPLSQLSVPVAAPPIVSLPVAQAGPAIKQEKPPPPVAMDFEAVRALLEAPVAKYSERPYRLRDTIR